MMVGKVGVNALTTVSICQQPVFVTLAASNGINVCITTIITKRKGEGDVKFTARTSMLSVAIIGPTLSFLLCYPIGLGLLGSWIGMFIDQTIRFTVNNTRFNNLKWMKISV